MNWSLKLTTPPAVEPVSLAELKANLHVTYTAQDTTLSAYIVAARTIAEDYQRLSYITQKWELTLDGIPPGDILLLRGPVQTVDEIAIIDVNGDANIVGLSNFTILTNDIPARVRISDLGEWPDVDSRFIGSVRIKYTTGYGAAATAVPADIKHAIMLLASHMDDNRAAENEMPAAFKYLLNGKRIHIDEPV